MAYKFSVGAYAHSGSLSSTSDITGSTTVSGAVGQFGTLTVATFSPANISSTNITASTNISSSTANIGTLTVGTFSPTNISTTTLTVTGVTTLSGNVFLGDAAADVVTVNGQITGSLFAINGGSIDGTTIGATTPSSVKATTLSASSTLEVGGTLTVAGATTLNGNLTVNGNITYVSSSAVEFKDVNLIIASGTTTSLQANGAGLTVGSIGYQLKFVSGSMGTTGDSWQFSGSTGYTDFTAGNITGTSLLNTKIVESLEATGSATINISKYITLANSTAADITANLPAAGPSFTGVTYKVKNVGTKSVFVKTLGGTIDGVAGSTGVTLGTQYAAATFVSDGADWFVF